MINKAEASREADMKKKELVEVRNKADTTIHET